MNATLLKTTKTRCPVCHEECPGSVVKIPGTPERVELHRQCPEHGAFQSTLASDARFYWLSRGSASSGCCGSAGSGGFAGTLGRNACRPGAAEQLSTCLALIEIVDSCNLSCPACFAASPQGVGERLKFHPLPDIQRRVEGVIARKGKIEILQLSGGEPTLHPQFFALLAWAQAHEKIEMILVNTNGVKIASDAAFSAQLAEAAARKKLQLYLQFDGPQEEGQRYLRGADLRETRARCIARCGEMGLTITLAMTVTPQNLPHVWETASLGLAHRHIQGVTFQPMFGSGRKPEEEAERLNAADILLGLINGSSGLLSAKDFTPLPCGDPNCAIIGYLLRDGGPGGGFHSLSRWLDFQALQGFLKDRINYRPEDLARCGCESEPLGRALHDLEHLGASAFRLMVKPFMDAWTWDQDRIDRCCTHVIRPDGQLDSFCRYYSGFSEKC